MSKINTAKCLDCPLMCNPNCENYEKPEKKDEASGTTEINGYECCPDCNSIVGVNAYYCKRCGNKIREIPEKELIAIRRTVAKNRRKRNGNI